MTTDEFKPTFDNMVGVIGPGGFTPINPHWCATEQCAKDLASLLSDLSPEIVQKYPLGDWPATQNVFGQSKTVPFLKFTRDGVDYFTNAGLIAKYWTHGFPPAFAEQQARGDIALQLAGS